MIRAQSLAKLPIGVSGNSSLSEAFSLRKLPFYNYRNNSDNLWTALRNYATKLQLNDLEQYFSGMHHDRTEKPYVPVIGAIKLTPDLLEILQEQWKILCAHLNENKNVEKPLLSLVYQRLLQKENLYFKQKFQQIQDEITTNAISEEQGLLALRRSLSSFLMV